MFSSGKQGSGIRGQRSRGSGQGTRGRGVARKFSRRPYKTARAFMGMHTPGSASLHSGLLSPAPSGRHLRCGWERFADAVRGLPGPRSGIWEHPAYGELRFWDASRLASFWRLVLLSFEAGAGRTWIEDGKKTTSSLTGSFRTLRARGLPPFRQ